MKKLFIIAGFLLFAAFLSCRKENGTPPFTLPANTWLFGTTTSHAAYSDLITRKGYQIVFHPEGSAGESQNISFQFTSRPSSGGTYKPAKDTFSADAVKIILRPDTTSRYYSIGNDEVRVQATIIEGKLNLTGNNIRMRRDTVSAYADTTTLSFNLTEF